MTTQSTLAPRARLLYVNHSGELVTAEELLLGLTPEQLDARLRCLPNRDWTELERYAEQPGFAECNGQV